MASASGAFVAGNALVTLKGSLPHPRNSGDLEKTPPTKSAALASPDATPVERQDSREIESFWRVQAAEEKVEKKLLDVPDQPPTPTPPMPTPPKAAALANAVTPAEKKSTPPEGDSEDSVSEIPLGYSPSEAPGSSCNDSSVSVKKFDKIYHKSPGCKCGLYQKSSNRLFRCSNPRIRRYCDTNKKSVKASKEALRLYGSEDGRPFPRLYTLKMIFLIAQLPAPEAIS